MYEINKNRHQNSQNVQSQTHIAHFRWICCDIIECWSSDVINENASKKKTGTRNVLCKNASCLSLTASNYNVFRTFVWSTEKINLCSRFLKMITNAINVEKRVLRIGINWPMCMRKEWKEKHMTKIYTKLISLRLREWERDSFWCRCVSSVATLRCNFFAKKLHIFKSILFIIKFTNNQNHNNSQKQENKTEDLNAALCLNVVVWWYENVYIFLSFCTINL